MYSFVLVKGAIGLWIGVLKTSWYRVSAFLEFIYNCFNLSLSWYQFAINKIISDNTLIFFCKRTHRMLDEFQISFKKVSKGLFFRKSTNQSLPTIFRISLPWKFPVHYPFGFYLFQGIFPGKKSSYIYFTSIKNLDWDTELLIIVQDCVISTRRQLKNLPSLQPPAMW